MCRLTLTVASPLSKARIVLLSVLAVSTVAAGGLTVVRQDLIRDRPTGAADRYWRSTTDAAPPVLTRKASKIDAGVNGPDDRSFELRWRATRATTYFFVHCDHGRVYVEVPGGGAFSACSGQDSLVTAIGSHAHDETITFKVEQNQTQDWGGALYR